ncbi:Biopolymer transport protein ExbD [Microbulbifer donghaiensis]|uniref:Biopolymer transport protein ExbD n=1 Tax=Microbulbifer donghaiensis TaxID=494016 RepID=A0A1M5A1G6_9GAMM|nr:biopolymer transporter ExbD [Microbulbifer donghaiensis]SHF24118.1 Biopolymer transport protein ExbD [Microbulbifer donghaiensis]
MNLNVAAKLQDRKQRQQKQQSKLNLVSLMDIFTILVFFLLVNSSDVEVLQTDKNIKLPESTAQQKPDVTTVVRVNNAQLFVGDRLIAQVKDIDQGADSIEPLRRELEYRASRAGELPEDKKAIGRAVTIMGDEQVPYQLLKQIMQTCAAADFRDMSFAVSQTAPQDPPGVDS